MPTLGAHIMIIGIGDIVKLRKHGQGGSYTTYHTLAKELKITNWHESHLPPYNVLYTIKAIANSRRTSSKIIAYIEQIQSKKGYLIDINCLDKVNEFLSEDEMIL